MKKSFNFRLNEKRTKERISCGEYVDAVMKALNATHASQHVSISRSPATVSNVSQAYIGSVPPNLNDDRVRLAGGNERNPLLSEKFMMLIRSHAVEHNITSLDIGSPQSEEVSTTLDMDQPDVRVRRQVIRGTEYCTPVGFEDVTNEQFNTTACIPWFTHRDVLADTENSFEALERYSWDGELF